MSSSDRNVCLQTGQFSSMKIEYWSPLSGGEIAGIVIGTLVGSILVVGAIFFIYKKRDSIRRGASRVFGPKSAYQPLVASESF